MELTKEATRELDMAHRIVSDLLTIKPAKITRQDLQMVQVRIGWLLKNYGAKTPAN